MTMSKATATSLAPLSPLLYRGGEGVVMALELQDLTDEERLALVALLGRVVEADTYVTDPEAARVRSIIAAVGQTAYQAAAEEADRRLASHEELRHFLATIKRQEARDLIYETMLEAALADVPVKPEREILDWLADIWSIKTRIIEPTPKES
jgi:uncharacterized tellurite resistance protein B-like protein